MEEIVICRCGHEEELHARGREAKSGPVLRLGCTFSDLKTFKFCSCNRFHEAKSQEEIMMAKEKKVHKPKGEGRIPTLAPYAEILAGKTIYMNHGGKEHSASVLTSGVIRMNDKDYTSPSSAGSAILGKDKKGNPRQVDGWKSWYFNKDGSRVMLNTLRGSKSPLALEAPKPRKAKSAKANGPAKPKRAHKAAKPKANHAPAREADVSDRDVPQDGATA